MRISYKYALIMLVFSMCFTTRIYAQKVKSVAKVSVNIVATLIAVESDQLDFGEFSLNGSRCEIKVTPQGSRILEGAIGIGGQTYNAGKYYISGYNSELYEIVMPYMPTIISNNDKSKSMFVFDWQIDINNLANSETKTTEVCIGATLFTGNLNTNATGIYNGAYAITFMYN